MPIETANSPVMKIALIASKLNPVFFSENHKKRKQTTSPSPRKRLYRSNPVPGIKSFGYIARSLCVYYRTKTPICQPKRRGRLISGTVCVIMVLDEEIPQRNFIDRAVRSRMRFTRFVRVRFYLFAGRGDERTDQGDAFPSACLCGACARGGSVRL